MLQVSSSQHSGELLPHSFLAGTVFQHWLLYHQIYSEAPTKQEQVYMSLDQYKSET